MTFCAPHSIVLLASLSALGAAPGVGLPCTLQLHASLQVPADAAAPAAKVVGATLDAIAGASNSADDLPVPVASSSSHQSAVTVAWPPVLVDISTTDFRHVTDAVEHRAAFKLCTALQNTHADIVSLAAKLKAILADASSVADDGYDSDDNLKSPIENSVNTLLALADKAKRE